MNEEIKSDAQQATGTRSNTGEATDRDLVAAGQVQMSEETDQEREQAPDEAKAVELTEQNLQHVAGGVHGGWDVTSPAVHGGWDLKKNVKV